MIPLNSFFLFRGVRADGYTRLYWTQEIHRFDSCYPDKMLYGVIGNTTVFGAVVSGSIPDKATIIWWSWLNWLKHLIVVQEIASSNLVFHPKCAYGGIGRHGSFRNYFLQVQVLLGAQG